MDIHNIVQVGHEGVNKQGEKFIVIKCTNCRCATIKFMDEFGAEITRECQAIRRGRVRNPYAISCVGVGRIGMIKGSTKKKEELKKQASYWRRVICRNYARGRLPHLNQRWLVFEYFLADIQTLVDYDLFASRDRVTIHDPFCRYDRLEHLRISEDSMQLRGVVVVDLLTNEYDLYSSRFECAYETGWYEDTIFHFCHAQAERDGYKYYWASDYADLFMSEIS